MKAWLIIYFLFSSFAFAQEQLVLRVNENGLMKVMKMALKYNTGTANNRTVVIPQNLYQFTIKQKDIIKNPIINIMNEISDLNLEKDLTFYLKTSEIKISGVVDPASLSTSISNSSPSGFDVKLSINLTKINVTASSISLCEDRQVKYKKCGGGLKTTATGLKVVTLKRPVVLTTVLRVSTSGGFASVKVLSVSSNLESKSSPGLDINLIDLEVPRLAIVINGQETELDTSKLKDKILEKKDYLGRKLLSFAGDFIANDLAEMINIYLKNTNVATTVQVYHRQKETPYNELEDYRYVDPYIAVRDNTYVRPAIILPQGRFAPKPAKDVMQVMIEQFTDIIQQAKIDLSLKSMSTPLNKDVELAGVLNLVLNHTKFNVKNTLGNSARTLPVLNLSSFRQNDINLAISEPVLNGALDLVNSTGLFRELLEEVSDEASLSLNSLKLHFTNSNSFKAIVNVSVDLKKVRTSFWNDPKGWAETGIGVWLERNNNNSVIYFPIEIEVIPVVTRNATTGGVTLSIKLKSAFNGDNLLNTYGYPSNVGKMYNIVRKGVISKLHSSLDQYSGKVFDIDLTKFLNQSGVVFLPKSIVFTQSAYMLLNLDIQDIKFDSLNPNKK
jgi:hypothetical protein